MKLFLATAKMVIGLEVYTGITIAAMFMSATPFWGNMWSMVILIQFFFPNTILLLSNTNFRAVLVNFP